MRYWIYLCEIKSTSFSNSERENRQHTNLIRKL
uniref:Uncharacterized protein n=1 Tax=Arundo donax TaxID=35708 RepID=A0A0A9FSS1_ARUDO